MDVLRAGCDAGITPDGPRGPVYEMKAGALVVARRAAERARRSRRRRLRIRVAAAGAGTDFYLLASLLTHRG